MRSKIAERIQAQTSEETKNKVRIWTNYLVYWDKYVKGRVMMQDQNLDGTY